MKCAPTAFLACAIGASLLACGGAGGDPPPSMPTLSGITVSPTSVTLTGVGTTAQLTASLQPLGVGATITFASADPTIASVSGSGASATVTAVRGGSTQITASAGAFTASTAVTVTPIARAIVLADDTLRLMVGESASSSATIDADAGADTSLTWMSSDAAIASVSALGTVTALAPGTATLSVSLTAFPTLTASRPVRVRPAEVQVAVSPDSASLLTGTTLQLTAQVTATAGVDTAVIWSAQNAAIASVDSVGVATAVAPGTTYIVATSVANTERRDSARITVTAPSVRSITIEPAVDTLSVGETRTLVATVVADSGVNSAIEWSSSASSIASVSDAGVVTAIAPGGPVTISATSLATPDISGVAQIIVESPPPNEAFEVSRVGVGGIAGGYGGVLLSHYDANNALAGVGFQRAGGGTFANAHVRVSNGASSDLTSPCCTGRGLPSAIAADSPTSALLAFSGNAVFGGPVAPVVYRTLSSSTITPWLPSPGVTLDHVTHLRANGATDFLALTYALRVQRYETGSGGGTWTTLGTVDLQNAIRASQAVMTGAEELVALGCDNSTPTFQRWTSGVQTTLPPPPAACAVSEFDTELSGRTLSELLAINSSGLHEFDGTVWTTRAPAAVGSDALTTAVACGTDRFAAAQNGRVYALTGSQWQSIGEPGVITALSEFSSDVELDCASSGPLRVLSGSSMLVRRTAGGWTEENFAPDLRAVHASSSTNAYAVGDGLVYRWNGSTWVRAHLFTSPDLRLRSVISTGANHLLAVGAIRREASGSGSSAGMLRFNGSTWEASEVAQYSELSSLVSIGGEQALALARTPMSANEFLVRFNGSSWSSENPVIASVGHLSASGPDNAFALGTGGQAARYNGVSWSVLPSIPGPFQAFTGSVYTASPTFAMAGNCTSTVARLVRWDGSTWTDTPLAGLPAVKCVRSLFGTSPTNVFAIVDAPTPRLIRWDGSAWSVVDVGADGADMRRGSAAPGAVIVTGFRGFTAVSRPPIP